MQYAQVPGQNTLQIFREKNTNKHRARWTPYEPYTPCLQVVCQFSEVGGFQLDKSNNITHILFLQTWKAKWLENVMQKYFLQMNCRKCELMIANTTATFSYAGFTPDTSSIQLMGGSRVVKMFLVIRTFVHRFSWKIHWLLLENILASSKYFCLFEHLSYLNIQNGKSQQLLRRQSIFPWIFNISIQHLVTLFAEWKSECKQKLSFQSFLRYNERIKIF